jgi:CSLREA domain-containing protein
MKTFLVALLPLVLAAPGARASDLTYTVNTTADGIDANPGDGVCATSGGLCTLRAAVMESNHTVSAPGHFNTVDIVLPASDSSYVLTILPKLAGDPSEISGALKVTRDVRILGGGAGRTIIDGNGVFRVFTLDSNLGGYNGIYGLTVSDVTIRNGTTSGFGGGIYDDQLLAPLTLVRCIVTANTAGSGGGGIAVIGTASPTSHALTLDHSTVSGNSATGGPGGGVYSGGDYYGAQITASTISGNTASTVGGGVYLSDKPHQILYSTIASNTAGTDGGSIGGGGGIYAEGSSATVYDTVVSGNHHTVPGDPPTIAPNDCTGSFGGRTNLVSTKSTCVISGLETDPFLGSLKLNGGSLPTHALLPGSPAIGAGDGGDCALVVGDERGAHRPAGAACDLGAYEYDANGDVNGDGMRDVADVFFVINFLFAGGPAPMGLADVNGDGKTDIADVFFLINFLFAGGPAPL